MAATALRNVLERFLLGLRLPRRPRLGGFDGVSALVGLLAAGATAALLAFWWHNLGVLVNDIRPVVSLERVDLSLARGESVVIGRRELLQPARFDSAELRHVQLAREADGRLMIRNVARERRLWLDYAGGSSSFSARWRLEKGDRVQAGGMTLIVEDARPNAIDLALRSGDRPPVPVSIARTTAGVAVTVAGEPLRSCQPPTPLDRFKQAITNLMTSDERQEDRILHIGGRLSCSVRMERYVAADRVPFRSFAITARGDRFFFAAGDPLDAPRPPVVFQRGDRRVADFQSIGWEVDPAGPAILNSIIIGRTRYDLRLGPETNGRARVSLIPVSKTHRLPPDEAKALVEAVNTPQVTVSVTPPRQPMSLAELGPNLSVMAGAERLLRLAVILGALGLAALAALSVLRDGRTGWLGRFGGPILILGLVGAVAFLVLTPEIGRVLNRPVSYVSETRAVILAYAIASVVILFGRRFTIAAKLLWVGLVALCMLGNLTLLSLGIDGEKTDFSIHAQKNRLLFIDLVPLFAAVVAMTSDRAARFLPQSFFAGNRMGDHLLRAVPALAIVGAFVLWALVGNETGVGGFQPVEFAKLALIFVLAGALVSFARIDFFYSQRQYLVWLLGTIATVAFFFGILTAVPFLKSDYSPILIILATTVVLFFAFLLPAAVRRIGAMIGQLLRRADAPQARQRRLGWPRGGALAATLLLLLAINAALVYAFPGLANRAIAGQWRLPDDRAKAMEVLEQSREGAFRKPAERLLTWYDLDHHARRQEGPDRLPDVAHRDLGFQLLQSKIALAETPCILARLKVGAEHLPDEARALWSRIAEAIPSACDLMPTASRTPILEAGEVPTEEAGRGYSVRDLMRIPVIQNDFIATYMTVRFGLPMALLLMTAQFIVLVTAIVVAFQLLGRQARGAADEAARYGLAIAAVGVAALFGLHWSISWGNAIGILPVMGQPMTFLAAATSHHLLMALPGATLLLLAGRVAAIRAQRIHRDPP